MSNTTVTAQQASEMTGLHISKIERGGWGVDQNADGTYDRAAVAAFVGRRKPRRRKPALGNVIAKDTRTAQEKADAAAYRAARARQSSPRATEKQLALIAKLVQKMPKVPGGVMTSIGAVEIPAASSMTRAEASQLIDTLIQHEM